MPTDIDILRKIDRIHPYPAKFPVDLAMNYISKYTNIGNTVYDPFVGSGTTLLASRALERNAYGTDVNHIAVLISQFKLLSLSQNDIKELWDFIARFENSFFDIVKTVPRFYYKSIDHWFCADAITVLSVIKSEISKLGKNEQKIFCNLVFSSIIIDKTVVRYNIAIIDTALINKFSPLINENGKLAGELSYPEIYVIQ